MTPFDVSGKAAFSNIVGKGENAGHQHFLLFQNVFLHYQTEIIIYVTFIMSSANALNLDKVNFFVVWEWVNRERKSSLNLTLSQATNSRLFQTGSVCRQHLKSTKSSVEFSKG